MQKLLLVDSVALLLCKLFAFHGFEKRRRFGYGWCTELTGRRVHRVSRSFTHRVMVHIWIDWALDDLTGEPILVVRLPTRHVRVHSLTLGLVVEHARHVISHFLAHAYARSILGIIQAA